jgi:WD40 repeat protein
MCVLDILLPSQMTAHSVLRTPHGVLLALGLRGTATATAAAASQLAGAASRALPTGQNPSPGIVGAVFSAGLQVLRGHTGRIQDLDWSADNTFLLSCGPDGELRLWHADSGGLVRRFQQAAELWACPLACCRCAAPPLSGLLSRACLPSSSPACGLPLGRCFRLRDVAVLCPCAGPPTAWWELFSASGHTAWQPISVCESCRFHPVNQNLLFVGTSAGEVVVLNSSTGGQDPNFFPPTRVLAQLGT